METKRLKSAGLKPKFVQNYDAGLEARALGHIVENRDSIPQRIKSNLSESVSKKITVFDLLANVRKKADGAFVYSIRLRENKKIKASPPLGLLLKASNGVTNASNKTIPHPEKKVNKDSDRNPDTRYSERTGDAVSNRTLLANAFEGLSRNSDEYAMIQEYRNRIRLLEEQEEKLDKINAEIREIWFTSGKYDAKKLAELEAKKKEISRRKSINGSPPERSATWRHFVSC